MIADLDRTLRLLLEEEFDEMKVKASVSFDRPTRDWMQNATLPLINFFLYDVRENVQLRHQSLERMESLGNGQSKAANGTNNAAPKEQVKEPTKENGKDLGGKAGIIYQKRLPIRVDCFYMVTAWAKDPVDEHHLLTQAMLALYRYPVLPQSTLQGRLTNSRFEVRTALARHDVLTNPAEVWSSLDNTMRATTSLVVTLALDPWQVLETERVETVQILVGQAVQNYDPNQPNIPLPLGQGKTRKERLVDYEELIGIGGVVRDALQRDKGVAGVEVHVRESGLYTKTDDQGRFRFPRIWPRDQRVTLVINPADPKPVSKEVKIPANQRGDYDIDIAVVRKEK